ncbi:hypothetical protein RCL1_007808 [Eukaryota sp. TZLM3-RCL]
MTSFTRFSCNDLFKFSAVNIDPFTETYSMSFYLSYLTKYSDYCLCAKSSLGRINSYMIGKAEGENELWHGHISAVTVGPEYRRMGLARHLCSWIEKMSNEDDCYFVDLFVRNSNKTAIDMYKKLGYDVYRTVLGYYHDRNGRENAFDMRKSLAKDLDKRSMVPLGRAITPDELEWR